jgi:hypothetical protein
MNHRDRFWWRCLVAAAVIVQLFGLSMVLMPKLIQQFFGLMFFSSPQAIDSFDTQAIEYVGLIHAVLGAVMFGWGTTMLAIILGPFRRLSRDAWLTLFVSVAAWFLPDTVYSLWSGFWQNAVLNCIFAVFFIVPLIATYPTFCRASA